MPGPRAEAAHSALPEFKGRSPFAAALLGWLLLPIVLIWLLALLPAGPLEPDLLATAGGVGLIAIWRWSWDAVHFVRSQIYVRVVYPRLRARAEETLPPPSLHVVVTSYRMAPEMNAAVYGRLFDELELMQVPATVVACITDPADAVVLRAVFETRPGLAEGTALHLLPQAGTGKRGAMVDALELIAATHPPPGAQVVLMDGDTLLSKGSLPKTCCLLASQPDVGAVTTDNTPLVRGTALAREWYRLRMAQRHVLMCSMSLSRRLLVLTGRFSVFRADLALSPDFIRALERDSIEHWRLGRIEMVTGDDKSTWFVTLRNGWRMLYLPDVSIYCLEDLPGEGFTSSIIALMRRWYGNMARNNLRARRLGPSRLGTFVWFCLVDQRISPWTTMTGPVVVVHGALTQDVRLVALYAIWVVVSRFVLSLMDWIGSGRFHPFFPFVLYYTQILGAVLKLHAQHHLNRQRWTRQKVNAAKKAQDSGAISNAFFALQLGAFVLVLAIMAGAIQPDSRPMRPTGIAALRGDGSAPEDSFRPGCAGPRAERCARVTAPLPPTARMPRNPPIGP